MEIQKSLGGHRNKLSNRCVANITLRLSSVSDKLSRAVFHNVQQRSLRARFTDRYISRPAESVRSDHQGDRHAFDGSSPVPAIDAHWRTRTTTTGLLVCASCYPDQSGARLTDIFLFCNREDEARAKLFATGFEVAGFKVCLTPSIVGGLEAELPSTDKGELRLRVRSAPIVVSNSSSYLFNEHVPSFSAQTFYADRSASNRSKQWLF
jgi:hypothetical protein